MARAKQRNRITYPNGKIYVGMDLTGTLLHFGSVNRKLVEADHSAEQRRDFTIRKEILWQSETATDSEVRRLEIELIRELRSNDPAIGYNRSPRLREPGQQLVRGHGKGTGRAQNVESREQTSTSDEMHKRRSDGMSSTEPQVSDHA